MGNRDFDLNVKQGPDLHEMYTLDAEYIIRYLANN